VSVYMSLRFEADAEKLEQVAGQNREMMQSIAERARDQGCIHHRFAAHDGEVVVMDEWESPEAFQRFFEGDEDIPKLMQAVGVTSRPEPVFYRPLDTGDEF
jgi:heme-degrading monooxygenase HmoA